MSSSLKYDNKEQRQRQGNLTIQPIPIPSTCKRLNMNQKPLNTINKHLSTQLDDNNKIKNNAVKNVIHLEAHTLPVNKEQIQSYTQIRNEVLSPESTLGSKNKVFIRTGVRNWKELRILYERMNEQFEDCSSEVYYDDTRVVGVRYLVLMLVPLSSYNKTYNTDTALDNLGFMKYNNCPEYYIYNGNELVVDLTVYSHSSALVETIKRYITDKLPKKDHPQIIFHEEEEENQHYTKLVLNAQEAVVLKLKTKFKSYIFESRVFLNIPEELLKKYSAQLLIREPSPRLKNRSSSAFAAATSSSSKSDIATSKYFSKRASIESDEDEVIEILQTKETIKPSNEKSLGKNSMGKTASLKANYQPTKEEQKECNTLVHEKNKIQPPLMSLSPKKHRSIANILAQPHLTTHHQMYQIDKIGCRINQTDIRSNHLILTNIAFIKSPSSDLNIFTVHLLRNVQEVLKLNSIENFGIHLISNTFWKKTKETKKIEEDYTEFMILLKLSKISNVGQAIGLFHNTIYFQYPKDKEEEEEEEYPGSLVICVTCSDADADVFQNEADIHVNCLCTSKSELIIDSGGEEEKGISSNNISEKEAVREEEEDIKRSTYMKQEIEKEEDPRETYQQRSEEVNKQEDEDLQFIHEKTLRSSRTRNSSIMLKYNFNKHQDTNKQGSNQINNIINETSILGKKRLQEDKPILKKFKLNSSPIKN